MIGKQAKGKGFRGLLEYLESKEEAEIIGGNMLGSDARSLAAEFKVSRQLNPRLNKAVYHCSLSLPHDEKLSNKQWLSFCQDYLEGMGFDDNQYVIYRHSDRDHDHVHIVASRIRMDGTTVNDSWDYLRSEKLLRRLEAVYNLSSPLKQDTLSRSATTGQKRRIIREEAEWQQGLRTIPPESPKIERLQSLIRACASDQPTMALLVERLENQKVECQITTYADGMPRGISFSYEDQKFSGTSLGKGYTFKGLQKYLGVSFSETQIEDLQQTASGFQFRDLPERSKRPDSDKFYSEQLDKYIDKVIDRQREPELESELIDLIKEAETTAELATKQGYFISFPPEPPLVYNLPKLAYVGEQKISTLEKALELSEDDIVEKTPENLNQIEAYIDNSQSRLARILDTLAIQSAALNAIKSDSEEEEKNNLTTTSTETNTSDNSQSDPVEETKFQIEEVINIAKKALKTRGRGLDENRTFQNNHFQIRQVAEFQTYGWQWQLTIQANDGRNLLEMKGQTPKKMKLVSSNLSRQDYEQLAQIGSAINQIERVKQFKRYAQDIIWEKGELEPGKALKGWGIFEGQNYQIVSDKESIKVIAKDGRGEIFNHSNDPNDYQAAIQAETKFTEQDFQVFENYAQQLEQQRREAEQRWIQRQEELKRQRASQRKSQELGGLGD